MLKRSEYRAFAILTLCFLIDWQLALGGLPVSIDELEKLARLKIPLVRWQGMWVELNPEQITTILQFFRRHWDSEAVTRCLATHGGRKKTKACNEPRINSRTIAYALS